MIRFSFALLLLLGSLLSCSKDNQSQYEKDLEIIREYLTTNNINAIEHPSGMFYVMNREGSGANPTARATVTVRYKGYLLDGTVFDETKNGNTATFSLTSLISGWQVGVPLMKRGGAITMYLPSYLGYGRSGSGNIPPNSVIAFDIELVDFVD